MRWPATATLALSAVVAGYLGAIAFGALYWSTRLPKAGERVGSIVVSHPTAASPEVMALLCVVGLLATLACFALAYRLRRLLGRNLAFAMLFVVLAVSFSLAAWANISSPPF